MIDNFDEQVGNNNTSKKMKNDPRILRARGGDPNDPDINRRPTDPVGLSRSIVHVLKEHEYVNVLSVGPIALSSVMKAFRLASIEAEIKSKGEVFVCRQSEYDAEIGGKKAKGVCTRIFAIHIKFAL